MLMSVLEEMFHSGKRLSTFYENLASWHSESPAALRGLSNTSQNMRRQSRVTVLHREIAADVGAERRMRHPEQRQG